jgi:hypothetical protein
MERSEALLSVAEISLGLAGFGGIFMALVRERGAVRPADTYRLVLLLSTALSTLVLALVPVGLEAVGVPDRPVWIVSSALMIALLATILVVAVRWRRRYAEEIRVGEIPSVAAAIWILALATLAAQLLNAIGLLFAPQFGVFFLGLIFTVAFGSYLFARMLFLWRS